ncbi:MAG: hypothetical protein OXK77_12580 [Gemmatimonadota bacterium]|nr:hypothetical protein [Gemmatimonadota bacterium]MDE2864099.1 hypothetical protein [Gemmatimonadota bacterium]
MLQSNETRTSGVYGTRTVNGFDPDRQRWPNDWLAVLDAQLLDLLEDDHPLSVRHCFYRMTDPRRPVYVPKTENGYRRVQRRLTDLRRAGTLPYGRLVDSTRLGHHTETFGGAGDFLERVTALYRHDLWSSSRYHVEVWCESDSIGGVLRRTCRELAVSLYATRGFSSLTLLYEAAQEINTSDAGEAVVLYVGDFDAAGVLIDAKVETELRSHLDIPLRMERLAVNEDQIDEHDLPTKPRKASERRRPDVVETVEAEAMPAGILRGLVREAVEEHLPAGALDVAKEAEASERAVLMQLAKEHAA